MGEMPRDEVDSENLEPDARDRTVLNFRQRIGNATLKAWRGFVDHGRRVLQLKSKDSKGENTKPPVPERQYGLLGEEELCDFARNHPRDFFVCGIRYKEFKNFDAALRLAVGALLNVSPKALYECVADFYWLCEDRDEGYFSEVMEPIFVDEAKNNFRNMLTLQLHRFLSLPYYNELLKIALDEALKNRDYLYVLSSLDLFLGRDYAESVVRKAAEGDPDSALAILPEFAKSLPYVKPVLIESARSCPAGVFRRFYELERVPFSDELLRIASEVDPDGAKRYMVEKAKEVESKVKNLEVFDPGKVEKENPPDGYVYLYRGLREDYVRPVMTDEEFDKAWDEGGLNVLKHEVRELSFSDSLIVARDYAGRANDGVGKIIRITIKYNDALRYMVPVQAVGDGRIATNFKLPAAWFRDYEDKK